MEPSPSSLAARPAGDLSQPDAGDLLVSIDAAPAAGPGAADALISQAPLLIAIVAIFYFLIIRPQNQERKRHETLLSGLKKDDEVVTASGIFGRVARVEDARIELEVAPKIRIWVEKASVKAKSDGAVPAPGKEG